MSRSRAWVRVSQALGHPEGVSLCNTELFLDDHLRGFIRLQPQDRDQIPSM